MSGSPFLLLIVARDINPMKVLLKIESHSALISDNRRLPRRCSRFHNQAMSQTSIAPMLSVRRGAEAIEFYKSAFGAVVLYRIDAPDGAVVARLSNDGAEFWVADESPEHKNFSPETLGGGTVRIILIVEDPDSAFARAVAAGATVVWPVADQHGWRIGRVVDPFGHHWEIAKPVS